jgi:hypothetical protein
MAEEQRGFLSRLFGGRDDAPRDMPVDFFSLPMGANPKKDRVVGMDESGLPQYESPLGVRYIIRPTMPEGFETEAGTLARVAEVGRDAIEGTIDGVVSGFTAPARAARGEPVTYGDAFATAGTAAGRWGWLLLRQRAVFADGRCRYVSTRRSFHCRGDDLGCRQTPLHTPTQRPEVQLYQAAYERPNRGGMDIEMAPCSRHGIGRRTDLALTQAEVFPV